MNQQDTKMIDQVVSALMKIIVKANLRTKNYTQYGLEFSFALVGRNFTNR